MAEPESYETPLERETGEKDVHPEEERGKKAAREPQRSAPGQSEQEHRQTEVEGGQEPG
ncbi:hypothetical protein [Streptomyces sp. NPDC000229]|uniref:hypothetical protein n=1 Tax=Streptomyces sp. NPDC000229 TaxID=3154247 RepID=UPI003332A88E